MRLIIDFGIDNEAFQGQDGPDAGAVADQVVRIADVVRGSSILYHIRRGGGKVNTYDVNGNNIGGWK